MHSKLIFIDKRAPDAAKQNLSAFGQVVEFITQGVVYDAISGHPDIFMFQEPDGLVVAPQIPQIYLDILVANNVKYCVGSKPHGPRYPDTACYNALYTPWGVVHNGKVSSSEVLFAHKNLIHCAQAYIRCNAIEVNGMVFTSDRGLEKVLVKREIPTLYVNPEEILLKGYKNGFFGGCCGLLNHSLFVCGSIDLLAEASQLKAFLKERETSIVEIYDGPLTDIGGIFFI